MAPTTRCAAGCEEHGLRLRAGGDQSAAAGLRPRRGPGGRTCRPAGWQRLSAGDGAKGPRLYDWAYLPYGGDAAPGWEKGLLIRRSIAEPDELAFYLTHARRRHRLADLVRVAGTRWAIEACFEAAKGEVGLDQYEVRSWTGWHRHVTLAMLAHAYLAVLRKVAVGGTSPRSTWRPTCCRSPCRRCAACSGTSSGRPARHRGRARLVTLATTPPAARPPMPLAATNLQ